MNSSNIIAPLLLANEPTDATATTNAIDSAARGLGLKSVRAWVPDTAGKRRSSGAERARRHRERKEQDGMKPFSAMVPIDLYPALRELAKRTCGGEPVDSVLRDVFPAPPVATPAVPAAPITPAAPTATSSEARLEKLLRGLPAWRQWLLRRLLPPLASR
jgi:hypothetical protein